jgi:hypothetical protein
MSELDEIKSILIEIRDNQKQSLGKQDEHIALAQQQLGRSRAQIEESLNLQREAIAKQKFITKFAVPAILLCIFAIIYLIARYF